MFPFFSSCPEIDSKVSSMSIIRRVYLLPLRDLLNEIWLNSFAFDVQLLDKSHQSEHLEKSYYNHVTKSIHIDRKIKYQYKSNHFSTFIEITTHKSSSMCVIKIINGPITWYFIQQYFSYLMSVGMFTNSQRASASVGAWRSLKIWSKGDFKRLHCVFVFIMWTFPLSCSSLSLMKCNVEEKVHVFLQIFVEVSQQHLQAAVWLNSLNESVLLTLVICVQIWFVKDQLWQTNYWLQQLVVSYSACMCCRGAKTCNSYATSKGCW